jgi:hypothetical protein
MKRTKIVEIIAAKSTALVPLLLLILVFVQLLVEKQMRIFALWMFSPDEVHHQPLLQQEKWLTYYGFCLCFWEFQFFEMQINKNLNA